MKRNVESYLSEWKSSAHRKPLLLRGARQVGKTYCVRQFASSHFDAILEINFEQQKEYINCFSTLYPDEILNRIYALSQHNVTPGQTLIFLDEIQDCPNAILALRYFYEQRPDIHIIAAGSLLEFTLRHENFSMPVGRIQSVYMYPLSFKEFLNACGDEQLVSIIEGATLQSPPEQVFHERLLTLLRQYMVIGGMPEVVAIYSAKADLRVCQMSQASILDGYRGDFGKYASKQSVRYLQRLYDKAPGLIGQNFKYVAVDSDAQARDIKPALEDLIDAGLLYKIHANSLAGLPLSSGKNEKKFKLLFVDIGLVSQSSGLSAEIMMQDDILLVNRGSLAEQFVGQELLSNNEHYSKASLHYWERNQPSSTAEVDYVTNVNSQLVPIEVKSGKTGRLKSLQLLLQEKNVKLGLRVSQKPLGLDKNILSMPLYMISELDRLVLGTCQ